LIILILIVVVMILVPLFLSKAYISIALSGIIKGVATALYFGFGRREIGVQFGTFGRVQTPLLLRPYFGHCIC
jgi:hypothetical protein